MVISYSKKIIFIHNKKTAGTTITSLLEPFLDKETDLKIGFSDINFKKKSPLNKHSNCEDICNYVGKDIWNDFYKIMVVRNPWDLVLSNYFWWKVTPADWNDNAKIRKEMIVNMTFERFVLEKEFKLLISDSFLNIVNNKIYQINYLIRFENFDQDTNKVFENLGIPIDKTPILNPSFQLRNKNILDYYNSTTFEIIRNSFKKQIEIYYPDLLDVKYANANKMQKYFK